MPDPHPSALLNLQPGEICVLVFHDGSRREATWSTEDRCFHFYPETSEKPVRIAEVYEWWPAGVKF